MVWVHVKEEGVAGRATFRLLWTRLHAGEEKNHAETHCSDQSEPVGSQEAAVILNSEETLEVEPDAKDEL